MHDSAKVSSTESDRSRRSSAPTPRQAAPHHDHARHADDRSRPGRHAARERSVSARDADRHRRARRPLGQRLAERPLLLDGRAGRFEVGRRRSTPSLTSAAAPGATVFRVGSVDGLRRRRSSSGSARARRRRPSPSATVDAHSFDRHDEPLPTPRMASARPCTNLASVLEYWDQELPQDVCAAGRVQSFGKGSMPLVAGSGSPVRLRPLAARPAHDRGRRSVPSFYGTPLVAWQPALGADQYQVQWSKTKLPVAEGGREAHLRHLGAAAARARARGTTASAASTSRCRAPPAR